MIDHPYPPGTKVAIVASPAAGRTAVVVDAKRDGCPGNQWWSYYLGGLIRYPECQVEATGGATTIWFGRCPEHGGDVCWVAQDDEPGPCGCPREGCMRIVTMEARGAHGGDSREAAEGVQSPAEPAGPFDSIHRQCGEIEAILERMKAETAGVGLTIEEYPL